MGMLLVLYAQYTQLSDEGISYLSRAIFALNHIFLAGFTCWVIWSLHKDWLPLDRLERIMLWFLAFEAICFNSVIPALLGQTPAALLRETMGDDIWFLLLVCALAIHLYDGRWGVMLAVGFYVLAFALAVTHVLTDTLRGEDNGSGAVVIQIYAAAGMLLGFLSLLARYRAYTQRLQVQYELIRQMAFTDMLTGLPNRRMGYQSLQRQIALARRGQRPLSVCLWDIDHFKQINDTHGHTVGDEVLRSLSQRLRGHLRESDLLARWGGEEFLLMLPDTELPAALQVAERLRMAIASFPLTDNVPVTASFGLSSYDGSESLEQLLHRADDALYSAKSAGRDRVVIARTALVESEEPLYAAGTSEGVGQ
jgi:diguanylate cyclase (GGDEF)-like protein